MLPIQKLPESPGLRAYKRSLTEEEKQPEHPYDDFCSYNQYTNDRQEDAFFELRSQLLREQKYVCAYCGEKIMEVKNKNGSPQMKTEHFIPQTKTVENDLNYQNLLACCLGGQDKKGENHCDSSKGNRHLAFIQNPASLTQRDRAIIYKVNPIQGEVLVFSSDLDKEMELLQILNLNHDKLRSRRYTVWKNFVQKDLGEDERTWTHARIQELRDSYNQITEGHHKEFKDFILWYLEDKLRRVP